MVSAYFSDRDTVLNDHEIDFLDWRFPYSTSVLRDENIAALICPRPLQIQSGTQDQLFPAAGGRETAAKTGNLYDKLGVKTNFSYYEFTGRHDFEGTAAWSFLEQHFAPQEIGGGSGI